MSKSLDEQIGRNVMRARGDRTQASIAQGMRDRGWKWSQSTVWNIERGERPVRLAEAEDLASVLGIPSFLLSTPDSGLVLHEAFNAMHEAQDALRTAIRGFWDAQASLAEAAPTDMRDDLLLDWLTTSVSQEARELHLEDSSMLDGTDDNELRTLLMSTWRKEAGLPDGQHPAET